MKKVNSKNSSTETFNSAKLTGLASLTYLVAIVVWGIIILFNLLPRNLPFGGSEELRRVVPGLLIHTVIFALTSMLIIFNRGLKKVGSKPLVVNIVLMVLVVYVPLSTMEYSLAPFVGYDQRTSIFTRDSKRIWKLKPNTTDTWGGTKVTINGKGLRGTELPYEKTDGVLRILYLGDSVTFGYRLKKADDAFPFQAEPMLEDKLKVDVETINAGIGGYSPWQEHIFLEDEGFKYNPDIIVLTLVLNDFTQKFSLKKYGGFWEGYQLAMNGSFLVSQLERKSNIIRFIRKKAYQKRFGFNPVSKAEEIEYKITYDLIHRPHASHVKLALEVTLENLTNLVGSCKNRDIPLLIVLSPMIYQLNDPENTRNPSTILSDFCEKLEIPFLDLLDPFVVQMEKSKMTPEYFFIDDGHLNRFGNEVAAREIVDAIIEENSGARLNGKIKAEKKNQANSEIEFSQ